MHKKTYRFLSAGILTGFLLAAGGFALPVQALGTAVLSPGMKHRHYAPRAPLTIVKGESNAVINFLRQQQQKGPFRRKVLFCVTYQAWPKVKESSFTTKVS